jgi:hypothetical protein
MNLRHPKSECPVAGRVGHQAPPTAMLFVWGAILWGICLLGSSPAAMAGAAGLTGFSPFGAGTFAFAPLAELVPVAPVASGPVSDATPTDDSHSASPAGNSSGAGKKGLSYHPVPEPQSWVIAVSGLATLVVLQRLRRRPGVRKL